MRVWKRASMGKQEFQNLLFMRVWEKSCEYGKLCEYVINFLCEFGSVEVMRVWISKIHASMGNFCPCEFRWEKSCEYELFYFMRVCLSHASLWYILSCEYGIFNSMRVWIRCMRVLIDDKPCEYAKPCEYVCCHASITPIQILRVWFQLHATF